MGNGTIQEGECQESKYQLCLKAAYRQAFLAKFRPIFTAAAESIRTGGGHNGQCWLVTGYAAQQKGGPRASYQVYLDGRSLRVTIGAAKAAFIYKLITEAQEQGYVGDIPWPYSETDEASHLCHTSNCVRPTHIWMEDKDINLDRNWCAGQVQCPECSFELDACSHNPRCMWSNWATRCSICQYGML